MATLANVLARVREALMDTGSLVWTDAALTEAVRLALAEYNLAASVDDPQAAPATIEGLDGAAESTLTTLHESMVVWGAGGYAGVQRAVDRAESFQLVDTGQELKAWGEARLKEFRAMLGAVFPAYLAAAAAGSATGEDPAKLAAEVALLGAQADLASAEAAHVAGQESRAAAAAAKRLQDEADEAARRAELRTATNSPWGTWPDKRDVGYPDDYERS